MSIIHNPTWLETAPKIEAILPGKFDWDGWCEYVQDLLPIDVYYTWHISTQPHLFDLAVEALYWNPAVPLPAFKNCVLSAMESIGASGSQRNYMALGLCHRASRYAIAAPVPGPMPSGDHMSSVNVLTAEAEDTLVNSVLFGYEVEGGRLIDAISWYMQDPVTVEWSCIIPLGYITGTKSDERQDGSSYEHTCAIAQENARDALKSLLRLGVFTRKVRPQVRLCEIQTFKRTCIKLNLRLPGVQ